MEKFDDGRKTFRTVKMEERIVKELEDVKSTRIAAIYEQLQKEYEINELKG